MGSESGCRTLEDRFRTDVDPSCNVGMVLADRRDCHGVVGPVFENRGPGALKELREDLPNLLGPTFDCLGSNVGRTGCPTDELLE